MPDNVKTREQWQAAGNREENQKAKRKNETNNFTTEAHGERQTENDQTSSTSAF
jgi:hypothetical protein